MIMNLTSLEQLVSAGEFDNALKLAADAAVPLVRCLEPIVWLHFELWIIIRFLIYIPEELTPNLWNSSLHCAYLFAIPLTQWRAGIYVNLKVVSSMLFGEVTWGVRMGWGGEGGGHDLFAFIDRNQCSCVHTHKYINSLNYDSYDFTWSIMSWDSFWTVKHTTI